MNTKELVYRGNARVYLQGTDSLQPVDISDPDCHTYYIGSEQSSIFVKDLRQESNQAADAYLHNTIIGDFADFFNLPADIEILENNETIEITMLPGKENQLSPILWLGVLDGNNYPVFDIEWESIKAVDSSRTAFAALVRE